MNVSWKWRPAARGMALVALAAGLSVPALAAEQEDQQATPNQAQAVPGQQISLPPVMVGGSTYQTERTETYKTDLISVGDKDARPPREVPQSTTVLTREYLEDRNARSLDTVLRETPGIVILSNDNGRSSIVSRGFEFDSLYLNGLPAPVSSIYGTQPDMAIVDHVEILKGPSGLFAGAGEPAGAINMRLKQPTKELSGSAALSGDSWGGLRAEGDVSSPLNESGSVRARFVAADDRQKGWVKNNDNDTKVGYGSLQADLDPMTTATFSLSHMHRDIQPYNGLPTRADGTLLDVDRSTTTGTNWNSFDNYVTDYIGELERRFEDGGHAKVSLRLSDREVKTLYAFANSAASSTGNVTSMRWLARDLDERSLAVDAHVSKPVPLFGQEHNILVGMDYQTVNDKLWNGGGTIAGTNNLYSWNSNVAKPGNTRNLGGTETDSQRWGIYGQLRVKPISALTLIGGGRGSWFNSEVEDMVTSSQTSKTSLHGQFTPYAGVVFDVLPQLSAYASYTEIFQPQTEVDANGKTLAPREGTQYETGLKGEFFNNGTNASIAFFKLSDKNRALTNINGDNEASGEIEAKGFETEINGDIMPGWEVLAGYTFTLSDNKGVSPTAYTLATPQHMTHLWTKYRFSNGGLWNKLAVGGGVKTFSDFQARSGAVSINGAGYTVVDLMSSYDITEKVTATLSINNLFDRKYYERVGSVSVFNFYGEPMSATLRLKATF